jgi:hypothetical protein
MRQHRLINYTVSEDRLKAAALKADNLTAMLNRPESSPESLYVQWEKAALLHQQPPAPICHITLNRADQRSADRPTRCCVFLADTRFPPIRLPGREEDQLPQKLIWKSRR